MHEMNSLVSALAQRVFRLIKFGKHYQRRTVCVLILIDNKIPPPNSNMSSPARESDPSSCLSLA